MRTAKESDFFIDVPSVGQFRFGRRTFGDRIAIRADYLRLVAEFGDDDTDLSIYASVAAIYVALCVSCPKGWEVITDLDLTDPDMENNIFTLYDLFIAKEASFRNRPAAGGESAGEGTS